jgi:hypothetical protein
MQGSEKSRIRLIEKILGEDAFPNLILATTQWSHLKKPERRRRPRGGEEITGRLLGIHD